MRDKDTHLGHDLGTERPFPNYKKVKTKVRKSLSPISVS